MSRRTREASVAACSGQPWPARRDLIPVQGDGEGGETLCTIDEDRPVARAISSSDHPVERAAVMAPSNDRLPWMYANEAFKRSARISRLALASLPRAYGINYLEPASFSYYE